MDFVLDYYKWLLEPHQILFKNFLNDIILGLEHKKINKWKKSLWYKTIEKFNYKLIEDSEKYLNEKWINDEDIEDAINKGLLNENVIYKELFWTDFSEWYEAIALPIYIWSEENFTNDALYIYRRDILEILIEFEIIVLANFNVIDSLDNIQDEKTEFFFSKYLELKETLSNKYWKRIMDEKFKLVNWKGKYIEFISFKPSIIKELIEKIEAINNKKLIYKNHTLSYNLKHYPLTKVSQRERFISLFFSSDINFYTIKEIIDYIEFDSWDFYNAKTRKQVLDLYKAINKTVEKKLWIKELFYLWEWLDKGKIFIKR